MPHFFQERLHCNAVTSGGQNKHKNPRRLRIYSSEKKKEENWLHMNKIRKTMI